MRIGELLVTARLVTEAQIAEAVARQRDAGGRLGQNLVAIGAISDADLDRFIVGIPADPLSLADTGIDEKTLLDLLLKIVFIGPAESIAELSHIMRLAPSMVAQLIEGAVRSQLLIALGAAVGGATNMRYQLTDAGRRRGSEAYARSGYIGAAPVSLESYTSQLDRQRITNERIDWQGMRDAFSDLEVSDAFVDQIGPAVSSGRALLMYGPPGNGKTSVAQRLERVFRNIIYIPFAVSIEGQIMLVFDPDVHRPVNPRAVTEFGQSLSLLRDNADPRWVACWRPFIVTGGELTLEMLDLQHEATANFYVAPLHVKAAGGCLLIDDFGRQRVSPTALLNRWIVPLESRVDYMKLATGKSFRLPFEAIVIFSTNLEPADLMDPAFLRRIPYKLEVRAPEQDSYRRIFESVCAARGMGGMVTDRVFDHVINRLKVVQGLELAAFQPRFLIDQVEAVCKFRGVPPSLDLDLLDYAVGNLVVGRSAGTTPTLAKVA